MKEVLIIDQEFPNEFSSYKDWAFYESDRILKFSQTARREGLLALENSLQEDCKDLFGKYDIFTTGMQLVIDGTETDIIYEILNNLLDHYENALTKRILKMIIVGIIGIQSGDNLRIIKMKMDSIIRHDLRNLNWNPDD